MTNKNEGPDSMVISPKPAMPFIMETEMDSITAIEIQKDRKRKFQQQVGESFEAFTGMLSKENTSENIMNHMEILTSIKLIMISYSENCGEKVCDQLKYMEELQSALISLHFAAEKD